MITESKNTLNFEETIQLERKIEKQFWNSQASQEQKDQKQMNIEDVNETNKIK